MQQELDENAQLQCCKGSRKKIRNETTHHPPPPTRPSSKRSPDSNTMTAAHRVKVNVLAPHTQWGDRLFLASSSNAWTQPFELFTDQNSFPWWSGLWETHLTSNECKCYLQRGDQMIWETFTTNHKVDLASTPPANEQEQVTFQFGVLRWDCVVCCDSLTSRPIVGACDHPFHPECFEPYIETELAKENSELTCFYCESSIPNEKWVGLVAAGLESRYLRKQRVQQGLWVVCPNAACSIEIETRAVTGLEIVQCPSDSCKTRWCQICQRVLPEAAVDCHICREGLRDILSDICNALDEAAGTKCPECKVRGQKYVDECTHITCNCGAQFCYCCGKSKEDVDTSNTDYDDDRLYGHNDDWEDQRDVRCPMWIYDLASVYKNWPVGNSEKSQKKFHQIKAQKSLLAVKQKTDEEAWNRVLQLDSGLNSQVAYFLNKVHEAY